MIYSPKLTFVANGNNSTDVELAPDETIWFESLLFTTDRFGNLSLSPEGNDSGVIVVGMVHSGPPFVPIIHEESSNEGNAASGGGGSSKLLDPRWCNMVTPIAPSPPRHRQRTL
jgi:hypothetical protein